MATLWNGLGVPYLCDDHCLRCSIFRGCRKSSACLVEEGLKHIPGFADCNDTGCASVVDTVVEVIDAAGIHDLLPTDVRADELAHAESKLCHGSVILCTSKKPHLCVGQISWDWQTLAIWTYKSTCTKIELEY